MSNPLTPIARTGRTAVARRVLFGTKIISSANVISLFGNVAFWAFFSDAEYRAKASEADRELLEPLRKSCEDKIQQKYGFKPSPPDYWSSVLRRWKTKHEPNFFIEGLLVIAMITLDYLLKLWLHRLLSLLIAGALVTIIFYLCYFPSRRTTLKRFMISILWLLFSAMQLGYS